MSRKIPVQQTSDPDLTARVPKYEFTGRKQDQYKRGDFKWVRKLIGDDKPDRLWIAVSVWDLDGHAAHDTLGQRFTPKDRRAAVDYATRLIEDGLAKMTAVQAIVVEPHTQKRYVAADFGTFEAFDEMADHGETPRQNPAVPERNSTRVAEYERDLNITQDQAEQVYDLIAGTKDPDDYESVQWWVQQGFDPPTTHDRIMYALNEVLEGHGIEAITLEGAVHPRAEYINMGDMYAATILYDLQEGRFLVTCSWDFMEQVERETEAEAGAEPETEAEPEPEPEDEPEASAPETRIFLYPIVRVGPTGHALQVFDDVGQSHAFRSIYKSMDQLRAHGAIVPSSDLTDDLKTLVNTVREQLRLYPQAVKIIRTAGLNLALEVDDDPEWESPDWYLTQELALLAVELEIAAMPSEPPPTQAMLDAEVQRRQQQQEEAALMTRLRRGLSTTGDRGWYLMVFQDGTDGYEYGTFRFLHGASFEGWTERQAIARIAQMQFTPAAVATWVALSSRGRVQLGLLESISSGGPSVWYKRSREGLLSALYGRLFKLPTGIESALLDRLTDPVWYSPADPARELAPVQDAELDEEARAIPVQAAREPAVWTGAIFRPSDTKPGSYAWYGFDQIGPGTMSPEAAYTDYVRLPGRMPAEEPPRLSHVGEQQRTMIFNRASGFTQGWIQHGSPRPVEYIRVYRLYDGEGVGNLRDLSVELRALATAREPMVIFLDNQERDDGTVLVTTRDVAGAREDQSLEGLHLRWEFDGDDFASTVVLDAPDLVERLEAAGYTVTLEDYVPPDDDEEPMEPVVDEPMEGPPQRETETRRWILRDPALDWEELSQVEFDAISVRPRPFRDVFRFWANYPNIPLSVQAYTAPDGGVVLVDDSTVCMPKPPKPAEDTVAFVEAKIEDGVFWFIEEGENPVVDEILTIPDAEITRWRDGIDRFPELSSLPVASPVAIKLVLLTVPINDAVDKVYVFWKKDLYGSTAIRDAVFTELFGSDSVDEIREAQRRLILDRQRLAVAAGPPELEEPAAAEPEDWPVRPLRFGTVISGTLRDEDLLEAFASKLERLAPNRFAALALDELEGYPNVEDMDEATVAELVNETLPDALNALVGGYVYFGANEGDGSDFGFWPSYNQIRELFQEEFVGSGYELSAGTLVQRLFVQYPEPEAQYVRRAFLQIEPELLELARDVIEQELAERDEGEREEALDVVAETGIPAGTIVVVRPTVPGERESYPAAGWIIDNQLAELRERAPFGATLDVLDVSDTDGEERSIYDFNIDRLATEAEIRTYWHLRDQVTMRLEATEAARVPQHETTTTRVVLFPVATYLSRSFGETRRMIGIMDVEHHPFYPANAQTVAELTAQGLVVQDPTTEERDFLLGISSALEVEVVLARTPGLHIAFDWPIGVPYRLAEHSEVDQDDLRRRLLPWLEHALDIANWIVIATIQGPDNDEGPTYELSNNFAHFMGSQLSVVFDDYQGSIPTRDPFTLSDRGERQVDLLVDSRYGIVYWQMIQTEAHGRVCQGIIVRPTEGANVTPVQELQAAITAVPGRQQAALTDEPEPEPESEPELEQELPRTLLEQAQGARVKWYLVHIDPITRVVQTGLQVAVDTSTVDQAGAIRAVQRFWGGYTPVDRGSVILRLSAVALEQIQVIDETNAPYPVGTFLEGPTQTLIYLFLAPMRNVVPITAQLEELARATGRTPVLVAPEPEPRYPRSQTHWYFADLLRNRQGDVVRLRFDSKTTFVATVAGRRGRVAADLTDAEKLRQPYVHQYGRVKASWWIRPLEGSDEWLLMARLADHVLPALASTPPVEATSDALTRALLAGTLGVGAHGAAVDLGPSVTDDFAELAPRSVRAPFKPSELIDTLLFLQVYSSRTEAVQVAKTLAEEYPLDVGLRVWVSDAPELELLKDDPKVNPPR